MLIIMMEALFLVLLLILAVIDFRRRIVPDAGPALIAFLGMARVLSGDLSFRSSLAGLLILGGIVFLLALTTGGIGGGDVKLLAACGAFLGFLPGTDLLILSFFLSGIFSAIIKILPVFIGNTGLSRVREIPFVPFLALAESLIFLRNLL